MLKTAESPKNFEVPPLAISFPWRDKFIKGHMLDMVIQPIPNLVVGPFIPYLYFIKKEAMVNFTENLRNSHYTWSPNLVTLSKKKQ